MAKCLCIVCQSALWEWVTPSVSLVTKAHGRFLKTLLQWLCSLIVLFSSWLVTKIQLLNLITKNGELKTDIYTHTHTCMHINTYTLIVSLLWSAVRNATGLKLPLRWAFGYELVAGRWTCSHCFLHPSCCHLILVGGSSIVGQIVESLKKYFLMKFNLAEHTCFFFS